MMPVSPIEESVEEEGLRQDGEPERKEKLRKTAGRKKRSEDADEGRARRPCENTLPVPQVV